MPKTPYANPETGNLRALIEEEILAGGPISFARFMELALYCPNFGYYEQSQAPGREGDYCTSVSTGPLFGELLARQFGDWLEALPPGPRQIVEAGAHDGRLAADILNWLKLERPGLLDGLEYWILEPSEYRRRSQETTLAGFGEIMRWFKDWNELPSPGVRGVIFSNELLDAMPVHRLGWDSAVKQWFEWGVTIREGEFVWARLDGWLYEWPITRRILLEEFRALYQVLPDGFLTEANTAAADWWRGAASVLKQGRLLTLDYGLTAGQFFAPERRGGTLRAYYRHHQVNDLLARPGGQDLTAHVNFTVIRDIGEDEGLRTESLTGQAQFLTRIVERSRGDSSFLNGWTSASVRQFQTLTHPEHLGRSFSVLVQER